MNTQLTEEILNSNPLQRYVKFQSLTRFIPFFRWAAGITFILGLIDIIPDDRMSLFMMAAFVAIWAPGITFAFVGAVVHFTTGRELRRIAIKYKVSEVEVKVLAGDLLTNL